MATPQQHLVKSKRRLPAACPCLAPACSVVASALGIPALLPFLKAVCLSKKSWQARHTGIKIVQQIAILMGCAVLPHLKALVDIIKHGLKDENQKVRATSSCSRLLVTQQGTTPAACTGSRSTWALQRLWRGRLVAYMLSALLLACLHSRMAGSIAAWCSAMAATASPLAVL